MKLVILDDGHGKDTAGKRTPPIKDLNNRVIREWEFNSAIVEKLGNEICNSLDGNVEVAYSKLTVNNSIDTGIDIRVSNANSIANKWIAKGSNRSLSDVIFVSIHYNAAGSCAEFSTTCKGGIETLYHISSNEAKELAGFIQSNMIYNTKLIDRGIKTRTDLGVLNRTKMTAVLVECGFMDVYSEAMLMLDNTYHEKVVTSIVDGICEYFKISRNTSTSNSRWSDEEVKWALDSGIINNKDGLFDPVTKEVALVMMKRVFDLLSVRP